MSHEDHRPVSRSRIADEETEVAQNNPVSKNLTIITDKSNVFYLIVSEVNTDLLPPKVSHGAVSTFSSAGRGAEC